MTLYLTDNTPPEEVEKAKNAGVVAFKLYPAGATTNSDSGVTDIARVMPTLQAMARVHPTLPTILPTYLSLPFSSTLVQIHLTTLFIPQAA